MFEHGEVETTIMRKGGNKQTTTQRKAAKQQIDNDDEESAIKHTVGKPRRVSKSLSFLFVFAKWSYAPITCEPDYVNTDPR